MLHTGSRECHIKVGFKICVFFIVINNNDKFTLGFDIVERFTHQTSNLWITSRKGSKPSQEQAVVSLSLSKNLYTHCSVLVGSSNGFYKLTDFYTFKLQ